MNENSSIVQLSKERTDKELCYIVYDLANVTQVPSTEQNELWFAGQTTCERNVCLISLVKAETNTIKVVVNCEKMVFSSMLVKELKEILTK